MEEINTTLRDTLLEQHRIAEEKRITDRWDRIWTEYTAYYYRPKSDKKTFPDWAKTSNYSLNDKLV